MLWGPPSCGEGWAMWATGLAVASSLWHRYRQSQKCCLNHDIILYSQMSHVVRTCILWQRLSNVSAWFSSGLKPVSQISNKSQKCHWTVPVTYYIYILLTMLPCCDSDSDSPHWHVEKIPACIKDIGDKVKDVTEHIPTTMCRWSTMTARVEQVR
jgi:hypothetical protein